MPAKTTCKLRLSVVGHVSNSYLQSFMLVCFLRLVLYHLLNFNCCILLYWQCKEPYCWRKTGVSSSLLLHCKMKEERKRRCNHNWKFTYGKSEGFIICANRVPTAVIFQLTINVMIIHIKFEPIDRLQFLQSVFTLVSLHYSFRLKSTQNLFFQEPSCYSSIATYSELILSII